MRAGGIGTSGSRRAALDRALELLDLTLADARWRGRGKEIARARELPLARRLGGAEYGANAGGGWTALSGVRAPGAESPLSTRRSRKVYFSAACYSLFLTLPNRESDRTAAMPDGAVRSGAEAPLRPGPSHSLTELSRIEARPGSPRSPFEGPMSGEGSGSVQIQMDLTRAAGGGAR